MTAIVGVLNRHAAAIAADSAVTIAGKKVFNSANKIFALSKYEPIAIAMYNNSELIGTSWEIIIKEFRKYLDKTVKSTIREYADEFFSFLERKHYFADDAIQKRFLSMQICSFIDATVNNLKGKSLEQFIDEQQTTLYCKRKPYDCFSGIDLVSFNKYAVNGIDDCLKMLSAKHSITIKGDKLADYLYSVFVCDMPLAHMTGLVFVGYGDDDIFPSLHHYNTSSIICGKLQVVEKKTDEVHIGKTSDAIISPFAQPDVINTFVRGIAPSVRDIYQKNLTLPITHILNDIITRVSPVDKATADSLISYRDKELGNYINSYFQTCEAVTTQEYINPLMQSVIALDKEDLAEFAESLIRITSLKRKVSPDLATVGGPIDVMVISKGDGIIWIKRKHYFSPELNNMFFHNYYK